MPYDIQALLAIMRRLRDPETGCPWDVRQTFRTIAPYTIEEAYEVADAADRGDLANLRDELGDLLLQVVFHSQMACEQQAFDWDDVVAAICEKLVRRHPHVFGDAAAPAEEELHRAWEAAKDQERSRRGIASLMDDVPMGMPELQRALKLQKRAGKVGFDWPGPEAVFDKLDEELAEIRCAIAAGGADHIEEEVGDLLFTVVNLARKLGVDPGTALRRANAKFERRFRALEQAAGDRATLEAMALDEMEELWTRAKAVPGMSLDE